MNLGEKENNMSTIVAYPTTDNIQIGFFEGSIKNIQYMSLDYPSTANEIESLTREIVETIKTPSFDLGVACYGMIEKTSNPIIELNENIVQSLKNNSYGNNKTNMAGIFINSLKPKKALLAYPLTFDCLSPTFQLSGIPQIERRMVAHSLDHLMAGEGKKVVSVYLSEDEISVCAQDNGKIIDITNSYDGEGPITPTRSGFFQQRCPYKMAFSGEIQMDELIQKIRVNGGLLAHLRTSNLDEVFERIDSGDGKAKLVYSAMLYTIHKEIGRKATTLCGDFKEISLTGPLSSNTRFVSDLRNEIKLTDQVVLRNHSCPVAYLNNAGLLK